MLHCLIPIQGFLCYQQAGFSVPKGATKITLNPDPLIAPFPSCEPAPRPMLSAGVSYRAGDIRKS